MITPQQRDIIQQVFEQSNTGSIHFGQVIQQLITAQVESYFVDYRRGESTYYLSNGDTVRHSFDTHPEQIAQTFDGLQVKAAIIGAQSGKVMYPEFKQLTYAAGCIGYFVWISGKKVDYLGRNGEVHTEHFPQ